MLTSLLVRAMNRSDNPRVIRLLSHTLEKVTGVSESQVLGRFERKDIIVASFDTRTPEQWPEELRKYYATFPSITKALGSYSSYTGKAVTADSALEVAAVYAIVKILAEDMGTLPCFLYRRSKDRKSVELAYDDPRFALLHDLANPDTSAGEFIEALTSNAALGLDGFALIERNSSGVPIWMFHLQPENVKCEARRGGVFYEIKEGARWVPYDRSKIFHLKGFSLNGTRGDEILQRARHVIGIGMATQEYAGRFFSQDASAGIVLKAPVGGPTYGPDAIANIKKGWKEWHQGVAKSHEPAVLQQGLEVQRVDPDLEKLQIIAVREFQVREIARLFRMPLHKLADLNRAIQSNIEQQAIEYSSNTLSPWVRRWKDAIFRCLLTREEQIDGQLYGEHNLEAYVRGDFRTQSDGFARLLEKGVYSINEVRRWLNLNPVEGGDTHFIQLNMENLVDAANGEAEESNEQLVQISEQEESNV